MKLQKVMLGIVAAGLAAGAIGCAKSSSPKAGASATPTTAVSPKPSVVAEGACKYVTTAEASALANSSVKPGVGRSDTVESVKFEYCDYIFDPGNAPGVSVGVASLGSDSVSLFAQFRQSKASESEYQIVSGVGDEAFFSGQNLYVRKADKGLILYVGRSTGSPRGAEALPDEKRLAELVLGKL